MNQKVSVSLRKQSFYINYYNSDKDRHTMRNYHLHQDYEIFYLLEGECSYLINGEQIQVKQNQLVFIPKNVIHKTMKNGNENYKRIVINFRESFLHENDRCLIKQLFERKSFVIPLPTPKQPFIDQLIKKLLHEYQNKQNYIDMYNRSLLMQLLIESIRIIDEQNQKSLNNHNQSKKSDIADVITYINNNFNSNVSLRLLSQQFHMNEQYISRLFKQVTGCSVVDYLNAVRVNEAKRLLLETDMKVSQIAYKVGYTNNVHLWRVFNKITGLSPNQYRISQLN